MNFVSVSNEDGIAAQEFAGKELVAFCALKGLLRKPVFQAFDLLAEEIFDILPRILIQHL